MIPPTVDDKHLLGATIENAAAWRAVLAAAFGLRSWACTGRITLLYGNLFAFFPSGLGFRFLDLAAEFDLLLVKGFELGFRVGVRH